MIPRPDYVDRLLQFRDPELVKVLTGVRRGGKSSLLMLLKEQLIEQGTPPQRIIEIDFEYASNAWLRDAAAFTAYLSERLSASERSYLFVDEVQELESWAKTINGIRAEFMVDIYVTGSNSRMFIGEHLTYLSGRYVKVEVYPLSLAEYAAFRGVDRDKAAGLAESLYDGYVNQSAFPAVALATNVDLAKAILDGLYDSVFSRDIIQRGGIRDEAAFLRVASYLLDNIGSQTSANVISNTLRSAGHPISVDTVDSYIKLMTNAYLIHRCDRYSIRGKERLKTNGKYYVVDAGLRNRILGVRDSNRGHVTENVVYLELRRRGFEVAVGTLPRGEIDFIATKDTARRYIQVCETVLDPQILARELEPFSQLKDAYPCVLITKDHTDYSTEGISHLNLYDFLLGASV